MSLYHLLASRWIHPGRIAITCSEGTVTFGELRRRVARAAGWLAGHGLAPGDVLALQAPRSLAFLEVHLGALARGVVTLPLNDRYTPSEVAWPLRDAAPRLAVLTVEVPDASVPVVSATGLRAALDAAPEVEVETSPSPDDPATILYTSGTTGRPKGALLSHANLAATLTALHQAWGWSERDVLLHALPLNHVHGLYVAQFGALYAGARSAWLDRFEPAAAFERIAASGCTVFMGVPTFYQRFLGLPPEVRPDLSSMRLFTSGSAGLPAAVHRAFEARFGHRVVERYGMTEVGIVLSNPLDGPRKAGTVGLPLPGAQVRIVSDAGQPVGPGEVGEVQVRGPSVFRGYLGPLERSAGTFVDGWMRTSDLGTFDEDGYVALVGRRGELVITGGLNVYPPEVEGALIEHPAVAEVAVLGLPDPDRGERVVAALVPQGAIDVQALDAYARQRLAPYKVPREWFALQALPRNAMGKVRKDVLAQRLRAASGPRSEASGGPVRYAVAPREA